MTQISDRVELDDERYITDKGPSCRAFDMNHRPTTGDPYRRCYGVMWIYVVQYPGHMATAMCCKCHDVIAIDLGSPHLNGTTIAAIKEAHAAKMTKEAVLQELTSFKKLV